MTAIVSLLGIIGRFAGDLLDAATGWAGTLMFGRVPQSHRRYLAAIMGGSVLWVFLVIGFLLPGLLRWSLSTTPHPSFMTSSWLAFVVTLGVILVPLGVGAAAYLAPADGNRATGVRGLLELARGYVLAPVIGGLLIFLACVGLARKVRSARHGWSDAHIPIVVPEHGYDDTVETVHGALSDAGIQVQVKPASPDAEPARLGAHPPGRAEHPPPPTRSARRAATAPTFGWGSTRPMSRSPRRRRCGPRSARRSWRHSRVRMRTSR